MKESESKRAVAAGKENGTAGKQNNNSMTDKAEKIHKTNSDLCQTTRGGVRSCGGTCRGHV